jgi:L-fuculose-phosphate aldolase
MCSPTSLATNIDRERLCIAARRLFTHGHVVGNEGNLSQRLGTDAVLCTPTSRSKGDLQPEELCIVNFDGVAIDGPLRPTSEIKLHLEIYRQRPDVRYVVHAHPPHALAFAVAREAIPQGILPEIDFFLGEVPIAPYRTPGGIDFAKTITPFVQHAQLIVLASHGTVAYGTDLSLAVANTEMIDRYCYILLQALHLGRVHYLSPDSVRQMLQLKSSKGISDPRSETMCDDSLYQLESTCGTWGEAAIEQSIFARRASPSAGGTPQAEMAADVWQSLIERIATRVAEKLEQQGSASRDRAT